jgi:hypothetical protein
MLGNSYSKPPLFNKKTGVIIRPKENKPYLMVRTTREKEEERMKNKAVSTLLRSPNS